jgi:NitT/TauT family transport system ATP-binding protein
MPLISIEDVFVAYGAPPRAVLAGVHIEIEEGEFVCLLGQTGCGKSTLLRLVLGSEHPMRGRILIDGQEHSQPDCTRGYVPQRYSLFPDRTVLDNITFGPMMKRPWYRRRSAALRDEAYSYIERIGLREADASKYPHQLSGGMQQRVAIAQALINRPRILLMDEAFSALDSGTRREMQSLVRELWKATGTTILFVTHNIDEALRLGTRVLVLAKEAPDQGSRVAMDLEVPDPCTEEAIPPLVMRLEQAS